MKKVFLILLLFTPYIMAHGQCVDCDKSDTYKKNSLGLDLVPIVQNMVHGDSLIPYRVFYNRNLTQHHSIRAHVSFGLMGNKYMDKEAGEDNGALVETDNVLYQKTKDAYAIGGGVGYQWQEQVWGRLSLAFGVDAAFLWRSTTARQEHAYVWLTSDLLRVYNSEKCWRGYSYSLTPFVGCNLFLSSTFSLLAELGIRGVYEQQKQTYFTEGWEYFEKETVHGWGWDNIHETNIYDLQGYFSVRVEYKF